jgi:L-amino acid N-acyltransferase YncA
MKIRKARSSDHQAINNIYNQAVRQLFCTAHLEPVDIDERRQWFAAHPADRFPVFVAEDSGQEVTGWVSLGAYREGRQALAHVAEVSYYVDENSRGKGLGSRLLEHAVREAPHYGFSVLIAILLDKNPASIGLLEKYGFERWGSMPGIALIHGQEADHLYYGLKL